jgi:chaperonin cofactor prefoldin
MKKQTENSETIPATNLPEKKRVHVDKLLVQKGLGQFARNSGVSRDELRQDISSRSTDLDVNSMHLNEQMKQVEAQIAELKTEIESQNARIDELQTEITQSYQNEFGLKAGLARRRKQRELRSLLRSVDGLNVKMYQLQVGQINLRSKIKHDYLRNGSYYESSALVDASQAGVKINRGADTQDELDEAVWEKAMRIIGIDTNVLYTKEAILPLTALSSEDLAQNAASYPEMSWELDPESIQQAKNVLMSLPLIHGRDYDDQHGNEELPSRDLVPLVVVEKEQEKDDTSIQDLGGRTFALDRQLGLDQYVFMSWGWPYSDVDDNFIFISPSLLLDDRCIVTPHDVVETVQTDRLSANNIVRPKDFDNIDEYLASAVTGKDWVEIVARRLAKHIKENPDTPANLGDLNLGEIKFQGTVHQENQIGALDHSDLHVYADKTLDPINRFIKKP